METDFAEWVSASSEEDDFSSDSSDDVDELGSDYETQMTYRKRTIAETGLPSVAQVGPINLVSKLFNRERTGSFSGTASNCGFQTQRAFNKVPNRLGFCLKDIVPHCFLQGHMFMGLSACGQFLLSYKVCCSDNVATMNYSFNLNYKYTLYFWLYQPHKPLRRFYKCCLFDDHGVDNLKQVTMTQWRCADPRVLIVHGAAEDENEDSYITYIKVPRLGCVECKKLRDSDEGGCEAQEFRWYALCLKCNLTIHTKYSSTESDRKFNPYINLICPNRILILANGFVHMLHVELDLPKIQNTTHTPTHALQSLQQHNTAAAATNIPHTQLPSPDNAASGERRPSAQLVEENLSCDNHNNIVARIIADFSEFETDSTHSNSSRNNCTSSCTNNETPVASPITASTVGMSCVSRKTYDELIFTCDGSTAPAPTSCAPGASVASASTSVSGGSASGTSGNLSKVSLISHRGRRHHRIVTKSFRNGVTTVDLQLQNPLPSSSSSTAADKSNAYEFSEDNEKCEKIATLRKRRLADKKYEFSEDNSENILPFTKIRSAGRALGSTLFGSTSPVVGSYSSARSLHRSPGANYHFHNSPGASPSSSPHPSQASSSGGESRHCTPPPMQRASPITHIQQGFGSPPCTAPLMRSPSRHVGPTQYYNPKSPPHLSQATQQMLSFKPLGTLSPLQVSMAKRGHMELGAMSPNGNMTYMLSPRREEHKVPEVPLQGGFMSEKPVCTKALKRRYVEEDDAASVITSEEDDCISPGYHTSLPMEVHGSSYSEMQMISQSSYQQLNCASVVITQHSFDLETFTYYVISTLCQKNQKTYDVFYDWACELISICPHSQTIICLLMAEFCARDQLPVSPSNCLNCSRNIHCAFHRRQFECRIVFTWNMESGEWQVLDYGELVERKLLDLVNPVKQYCLAQRAKKLAQEMAAGANKGLDFTSNLRVLDSNIKKSKTALIDLDNMIEFHLKRQRKSD